MNSDFRSHSGLVTFSTRGPIRSANVCPRAQTNIRPNAAARYEVLALHVALPISATVRRGAYDRVLPRKRQQLLSFFLRRGRICTEPAALRARFPPQTGARRGGGVAASAWALGKGTLRMRNRSRHEST